jgi:hypothetical protein
VEGKDRLSMDDLKKLEIATIISNKWCEEFENVDCEGCPLYEAEGQACWEITYGGYGCVDASHHPFYKKVDHVWYCIRALEEPGQDEVNKQDLLDAIDSVIDYLERIKVEND